MEVNDIQFDIDVYNVHVLEVNKYTILTLLTFSIKY